MPQPDIRKPYAHALHLINHTNEAINGVTTRPDGRPRDLDPTMSASTLTALSNLALASALLAMADAVRSNQEQ